VRQPEPPDRPPAAWYRMPDPEPDDTHYTFTGYAEGADDAPRATARAEEDARARLRRFLHTEVIASALAEWDQSPPASQESPPPDPAAARESFRAELERQVDQSVRSVPATAHHVEKVTTQPGGCAAPGARYDAGALLRYPRAEVERLAEVLPSGADPSKLAAVVGEAAALWAAGDHSGAVERLRKAHGEFPRSREITCRLAGYLEAAGERTEAYALYRNLADLGGASRWAKLATEKIDQETDRRLQEWLALAGRRPDLPADDLAKIVRWACRGRYDRAREIAGGRYETQPTRCLLFAWYMAAAIDYQHTESEEARYDYVKALERMGKSVQSLKEPRDAEPAIVAVLAFAHHELGTVAALDALERIKARLGAKARFAPEVGAMATRALARGEGPSAGGLVAWLNQKAESSRPRDALQPPQPPAPNPRQEK